MLKCSFDTKVNLQKPIDIDYIARHGNNTYMKYNSNRVVVRSKKLNATAVIFKNGVMLCSGGRNREEAKRIARILARKVQKLGNPKVKFTKFTVVSIKVNFDLNINLEKLAIKYPSILYEPQLKKYAILTDKDTAYLKIYSAGKIIFNGRWFPDIDRIVPILNKKNGKVDIMFPFLINCSV